MILRLGDLEYAIPLVTSFAPKASEIYPASADSRVRKILHARKLAKAKAYLWRRGIPPWTRWKKDSTPG